MQRTNYSSEVKALLINSFEPAGFDVTKNVELDPIPESEKYAGLTFSLDRQSIVYRKAKVTADRPGAFLAIWQRPTTPSVNGNKPIPLTADVIDYLFVQVDDHPTNKETTQADDLRSGIFIFPVFLLIEKGIVASAKSKGKTGFRVFPPWSADRGEAGTQVFSASGKKTQRWQQPYFVRINKQGLVDERGLNKLLTHHKAASI